MITCLLFGVSLAWFYKWRDRVLGPAVTKGLHAPWDRRRDTIDQVGRCSPIKRESAWLAPAFSLICVMTAGRSA